MSGNVFENFKSNRPEITGSSTINHAVREKLRINCSQYCYLKYIAEHFDKNIKIDPMDVYKAIGFTDVQQNEMVRDLIVIGFLYIKEPGGIVMMTDKWAGGWPNVQAEFDKFWTKNGKVAWMGSKPKALELFQKVIKSKDAKIILEQRDHYFEYLEAVHKTGFNRSAMAAERWLNPKNEYYMEDYQNYIEQLKIQYPGIFQPLDSAPKAATITKDDINRQYEQNSDV
jgi:hypothetical protein